MYVNVSVLYTYIMSELAAIQHSKNAFHSGICYFFSKLTTRENFRLCLRIYRIIYYFIPLCGHESNGRRGSVGGGGKRREGCWADRYDSIIYGCGCSYGVFLDKK